MRRYKVTVETAADGSATEYSERVSGKLHQIEYVKDASTPYTNGVDFTLTGEATGISLWAESNVDASAVRAPRMNTHSQAGAALLYAAGGTNVTDRIGLSADRIKIVLASGGATKTGTFYFLIDES